MRTANAAVSPRAVIIGIVFALFFCAFTPYNDFKIAATYISGTQFPVGAVFVLLLFTLINSGLHRWNPRRAFRPGELLTIWTMILVASGLPSAGMMRYFLPAIVYPHYISDDKNNYEARVWHDTPRWLQVTDKAAAVAFFKGYPRGDEHVPWAAWTTPLFFWGILGALFLLASFSVASLLRRPWIENEKFSFPLVALPVLLAEQPEPGAFLTPILRAPLLWTGFVLVTVVHSVRGLHLLYPAIPDITMRWDIMQYLTTRPWNQIGPIEVVIYPMVIGISYLLSTEVCFSLWFFHLFYKSEIVLGVQQNWDLPGAVGSYSYKQFHGLEAFGGGVALLAWTIWTSRRHLRDVWTKALGNPGADAIDDAREMMSYRGTVAGLGISYGGIALWMTAAHVPVYMIGCTLLTMTLALVVIAWVVCQAGMLFMAQPYGSIDYLASTMGTAPFPLSSLYTMIRFENGLFYDTREMLTPSLLMGMKTVESQPTEARSLMKAMALSVALGVIVSTIASLILPYYNGGGNSLNNPFMYSAAPAKPLKFLAGAASVPYHGSPSNWLHILGGLAGVLGLLVLRARTGFGLHPIGFLCASVYAMHELWSSIFIAWACKVVIQRFGGIKVYRGALPFFLGLVLGDVVNAVIWIVLGYLTGVGYQITPN